MVLGVPLAALEQEVSEREVTAPSDVAKGPATLRHTDAAWSSLVARRAHNPKVAGSNPAPAMKKRRVISRSRAFLHAVARRAPHESFPLGRRRYLERMQRTNSPLF